MISTAISNLSTRVLTFPVYHRIRILNYPTQDVEGIDDRKDAVHVSPARYNKKGDVLVAEERFDTILVDEDGSAEETGMEGALSRQCSLLASPNPLSFIGLRVAQPRVVFKLSDNLLTTIFGANPPAIGPLVFVDWFSRPKARPEPDYNMFRIKRSADLDKCDSGVIPLSSIRRSCHLFPVFPPGKVHTTAARDWTSGNVLEQCNTFLVNNFIDIHTFQIVY